MSLIYSGTFAGTAGVLATAYTPDFGTPFYYAKPTEPVLTGTGQLAQTGYNSGEVAFYNTGSGGGGVPMPTNTTLLFGLYTPQYNFSNFEVRFGKDASQSAPKFSFIGSTDGIILYNGGATKVASYNTGFVSQQLEDYRIVINGGRSRLYRGLTSTTPIIDYDFGSFGGTGLDLGWGSDYGALEYFVVYDSIELYSPPSTGINSVLFNNVGFQNEIIFTPNGLPSGATIKGL